MWGSYLKGVGRLYGESGEDDSKVWVNCLEAVRMLSGMFGGLSGGYGQAVWTMW